MDGNGRWATARGLARAAGHHAGIAAVRRTVEAAPDLGIGTLTLFAFSADNWKRPAAEVAALMTLLRLYLGLEAGRLVREGVRLTALGRRDRLPPGMADLLARAETATAAGCRLHLRIALDYSSRDAIVQAAASGAGSRDAFARALAGPADAADVDLLIRTGGEKRLSDFLLWEVAYAELLFSDRLWPDFAPADLAGALDEFQGRQRRFGGLPAAA